MTEGNALTDDFIIRIASRIIARYEDRYRITSEEMLKRLEQGEWSDSEEHQLLALYVLVRGALSC